MKPTLDEIADKPTAAASLRSHEVAALLIRCAAVQTALAAALTGHPLPERESPSVSTPGQLLTVKEAAARLGISPFTLYQNARRYPFTVRIGRALRFSESGLAVWIQRRSQLNG
jgi:predicted DNA-binding transcriptional regulator AlpA